MGFFIAIVVISALFWRVRRTQDSTLLMGAGTFVAVGYVLQHPFWHASVGPVTFTVDRLLLAGLLALVGLAWRQGKLELSGLHTADWLVAALLGYLTLRCFLTPPAGVVRSNVGPWWRLIASFWMPAILYFCARVGVVNRRNWRGLLAIFVCLGGYLAFTAVAEVKHQWWAVFPSYISDPTLGTHFGRARGPALMSASLGVFLTICFWAAWLLWSRAKPLQRVVLTGLLFAMALGVYYTYTRSTWLGLAGGLAIVPLLQMPRRAKFAVGVTGLCLAITGLALFGTDLKKLGRKDSDASAEHSVYQRASFAYVSWEMFKDAPVFGHGVSRFFDLKMPYLADRRQQIELDSIRNLDHHNTLLSILVETGIIGFALFLTVLTSWTQAAWRLWRDAEVPAWQRSQGLFGIATMVAYLATALFHDLTLSPPEQWMLFLVSGVSVSLVAQRQRVFVPSGDTLPIAQPTTTALNSPRFALNTALLTQYEKQESMCQKVETKNPTPKKVSLLGMEIDSLNMQQTGDRVLQWCAAPRGERCRYVVTPNVDHAVMFQENAGLRAAYEDASLVLADGAPVVLASRMLQKALPERVAGSDLAPALFKRASQTPAGTQRPRRLLRVFLLGAAPGVAERARANILSRWAGVDVVGVYSPPLGFEHSEIENEKIYAAVAAAQPDLVLLGLGAPKQELWIHKHADRLEAKAALCIGATIDFLACEKQRAPLWMRKTGLEWLHRLATEPRRLAKRYLRDGLVFPRLVWREWLRLES
ncbi:MAG: WecB/TagA/CpsF family glycosyltransferase [Lacipirellulaceae bacterium]